MKINYRALIERYFLIDKATDGQLVQFKLNPVQLRFYEELKKLGLEEGLSKPLREIVLKARREGMTSFVLALFAADDILSKEPTETTVISYKDDATKTFRKRYKNYILSYFRNKYNIIEENKIFEVDSGGELILKHNKARFYCGTASARVGGRGGTVQKLLFSEAAFYPDKEVMKAGEIIEGTMRQVDINSGWVFVESTANGYGNHYEKMWTQALNKQSRFNARFFSWQDFYTPEEFELIKSEFTDKKLIAQEYPSNPDEAFLSSSINFFDADKIKKLRAREPEQKINEWIYYLPFKPGHRYCMGVDVSEGVGNHNSVIVVLDLDASLDIGGYNIKKPDIAAIYYSNRIPPDRLAYEIQVGGMRYGNCIAGVERNNHGYATLVELKKIYFNIYKEVKDLGFGTEITDKLGWHTNGSTKPRMLYELKKVIDEEAMNIGDQRVIRELQTYPSQDLNVNNVNEDDEGGHWDAVIALSIAWQMRTLANYAVEPGMRDIEDMNSNQDESFNRHSVFGNL